MTRFWNEVAVFAALCSMEAVYPTSILSGGAELGVGLTPLSFNPREESGVEDRGAFCRAS